MTRPETVPAPRRKRRGVVQTIAAAPHALWCVLFILAPMAFVVYYAFTDADGAFTIYNINEVFSASYLRILERSILYALVATAICLVLAYPLAYAITKMKARHQPQIIMLLMLPMWINLLIRTYSLKILLETNGVINHALAWVHLGPVHFLNSNFAIILGMVYNSISKILTSDVLEEMMAVNNIDMESLGMEQTFLFLITPDEKDTYNQMVGRFVSQTYYALIDKAQSLGGSLPVRVNILLDEFASLGKIKDVPSMLAAGRSRNIRCMIIIQSLSQLESVYGKEAESIRNNCSIWTYLGGRDCSFMDTLCRLCGNSENGKPLLTPTQLMHLEKGREAFVMVGREYPMIGRIADISEYDIEPFEFAEPALRWDRVKPKLIGKERLFKVPRQAEPDAVFRIRGDTVMIGPGMGARDEIAVAALFDSIYGTDVDVDEMDPLMDIGDALKTPVDAEWFLRSFMGLEDRDLKSFVNSLDLKDGVSKVKVRNGLRRIRSIV